MKEIFMSVSERCSKSNIQNCGSCDDINCCDNASMAKDAIRVLEDTLRGEQNKRIKAEARISELEKQIEALEKEILTVW